MKSACSPFRPAGPYQVPRNNAERMFFITINILGTCLYSAVVGQMAVLVANMNTIGLRHKQKEDMTMVSESGLSFPVAHVSQASRCGLLTPSRAPPLLTPSGCAPLRRGSPAGGQARAVLL